MALQGEVDTKPKAQEFEQQAEWKESSFQGQAIWDITKVWDITKFKGETNGLYGNVYNVGTTTQAEQFTETTKKLASYAGRTCKEPQDIHRAIEDLKEVTIAMPDERLGITDLTLKAKLYEKDIEVWSKRESLYRQNKSSMYSIALGQCLEAMKVKLEASTQFELINDDSDLI